MRISFGVYENSFMFDIDSALIQRLDGASSAMCANLRVDQIVSNVVSVSSNVQVQPTAHECIVHTRLTNLKVSI